MSQTTAETLTAVRSSIREAYKARGKSESVADLDTMHAFGLVTRDALSMLKPLSGLGKTARVARLRRADGDLLAAYVMTADEDSKDILDAASQVVGLLLDKAEAESAEDATHDDDGNQTTPDWAPEGEFPNDPNWDNSGMSAENHWDDDFTADDGA
jgi:hypothetical protein